MAASSDPSTPGQRLSALLARMELSPSDLAREAKLSRVTIKAAIAGGEAPSDRTRCAIEAALNQPIWSTPEDYQRRKEAVALIGFDPEVARLRTLTRRARQLGIKHYGSATSKPALTALILNELAARKKRLEQLHAAMDQQL